MSLLSYFGVSPDKPMLTDEQEINTDFELEAFEVQYYKVNNQQYSGRSDGKIQRFKG